jgi:hypothetical protein
MRRRALVALFAATALAACGIDALGVLDEVAQPPRPGEADATGGEDVPALADVEVSDAASDGEIDADADARPGCPAPPVVVADPFAALDGGSWIAVADLSNAPYPQIAATPDGLGASLVNPAAISSLGALWIPRTLPLHAFDVTFRYVMPCEAGTCSDGLAVAWLEATDAGAGALAGYVVAKASFALPQALRGSAVAFDLHQDAITGDPVAPYLSLLALDGAVPGQYAWHAKTAARPNAAGTHAVALRLRKGILEVSVDGALVQTGAVASRFQGWFGFGASSGDTVGTFVVRAFSGTFYACDDP